MHLGFALANVQPPQKRIGPTHCLTFSWARKHDREPKGSRPFFGMFQPWDLGCSCRTCNPICINGYPRKNCFWNSAPPHFCRLHLHSLSLTSGCSFRLFQPFSSAPLFDLSIAIARAPPGAIPAHLGAFQSDKLNDNTCNGVWLLYRTYIMS